MLLSHAVPAACHGMLIKYLHASPQNADVAKGGAVAWLICIVSSVGVCLRACPVVPAVRRWLTRLYCCCQALLLQISGP